MIYKNTKTKTKSWCYSLSMLAVLAGGVIAPSATALADAETAAVVPTAETVEAPAATPETSQTEAPAAVVEETVAAPAVGEPVIEAAPVVEPVAAEETATPASEGTVEPLIGGSVETGTYSDITVSFEFEDGTQAAPDVVYDNKAGYFPEFPVPQIPGYTASQDTIPRMDADQGGNLEIKIVYTKDEPATPAPTPEPEDTTPEEVTPGTPVEQAPAAPKPASPIGDLENIVQIATDPIITIEGPATGPLMPAVPTYTAPIRVAYPRFKVERRDWKFRKYRILPSTGETSSTAAIVVGGVVLAGAVALGLAAQMKRKKN